MAIMETGYDFFFSILGRFGWLGNWLFLFIALFECVPFIGSIFPGATLIVISGLLASQGIFKVSNIIIFATVGAFVGDYAGYYLGRRGSARVKKIIPEKLMAKGEEFFAKYGNASILWGRFFGATRAIIPFVAGVSRMPQKSFLIWNGISSVAWSLFHIYLGYFSGSVLGLIIKKWLNRPELLIAAAGLAVIAYWLIKRNKQGVRTYYQTQFRLFSAKSSAEPHVQKLEKRYPATAEFLENENSRHKIFNALIIAGAIIILYLLTAFLDWL